MDCFKTLLEIAGNISNLAQKLNIEKKTQTLKRKMETLASREADIRTQLDIEEKRLGKKRKEEANVWLKKFERLRDEVDVVVQNVTTSTSCWQLTLGSSLDKLVREAKQLDEQAGFFQSLTLDVEESRGYEVPVGELVGQDFQSNVEKIWDYLMSEEIQRIAVHGMGGVGKTTLVKHIHNRIVNDHVTFESSCWVTMSQDCSTRKLQDAIAKHLCLDFENENDEMIRVGKLCKALKMRMMMRKFVIILDDVWEYYPLEKIGIPFDINGCKLIFTSRKKDVCHQMNYNKLVEVVTLPEQEAWRLFRDNLGCGTILSQDVEQIAQAVARECAGLPLGIVVLSGIMKGVDDIHEWRNTLEELQESKFKAERMEYEVFTVLRFSYQRLSDSILQQCFLHIALHPEDAILDKEELIQYFIDSGLIERKRTKRAEYDKGMAILNKLVKSCLLGESERVEHSVRMHDLVRDMVIKETNGRFMVKVGQQLRQVPDESEWVESLEKVSLMSNNIKEIAENVSPQCPNILTLFLQWNPLVSIPDSFFRQMQTLQILNLSYTKIKELPDSFSVLENLIALDLSHCQNLRSVPSLAKMMALSRLNLSYSGIEEIPQGMEKLHCLSYLDLSKTNSLEGKQWPIGIIPQLSHLQYLNFFQGPEIIKAEELMSLKKLECLHCYFYDENEFSTCVKYVQSRITHLSHWEIALRDSYPPLCQGNFVFDVKRMTIFNCNMEGKGESFLLPNDVNSLYLNDCEGLTCMSQWGVPFLGLKDCYIKGCDEMEAVVNDPQQCTLFPKLRALSLSRLSNLKVLISNSLQPTTTISNSNFFPSLTSLEIHNCSRIKKLFTPPFLPILTQMEKIVVQDCEELEEIITLEDDDHDDTILGLPKLRYTMLYDLPQLKSICGAKWTTKCDSIKSFAIVKCPKLERIPLELYLPPHDHEEGVPVPSSLERVLIASVLGWSNMEWHRKK